MKHKDVMGKLIAKGDIVVFVKAGYVDLHKGEITKLTPKGVKVKSLKGTLEVFRYPSEVIVVSDCW